MGVLPNASVEYAVAVNTVYAHLTRGVDYAALSHIYAHMDDGIFG